MKPEAAVAMLLERLGLPVSLLSPLVAHAHAVGEHSPRLGLVSTGDEDSVLGRHTADSLIIALARSPLGGERWLDVGAGAGFPGLVLAACYPDAAFVLAEANAKKAGFLELQAIDLGLGNVEVARARAEHLAAGFDVAVSRAVADPTTALGLMSRLVRPGGTCIVAGTGSVPTGAQRLAFDLPFIDSPATVFMMTVVDGEISS